MVLRINKLSGALASLFFLNKLISSKNFSIIYIESEERGKNNDSN